MMRPFTPEEVAEKHNYKQKTGSYTNYWLDVTVVLAILAVVCVVLCLIWLYMQRKTRKHTSSMIDQRVSAAIHEYFALSAHAENTEQNFPDN